MRENPVKRRLAEGGIVLGTMVFEFAVGSIGRLAAAAGAEFLLLDQEHTGMSVETVRALIGAARADGIVPLVRVPDAEYQLIARVLDTGALGVMVPMVENEEEARRIAAWTTYPPRGRRGFGLIHRDEWEEGGAAATMAKVDEERLVIAQIENVSGLEDVERMAALDGIDVLWIGHFDLTASLGIPAQFDHPDYLAAVERVVSACRAHGKAAGIMVGSVADGRTYLERGFRMIAYSGDLWLYQQALADGLAQLDEVRKAL